MRAIYWLYQVSRVYFMEKRVQRRMSGAVIREEEEDGEEMAVDEEPSEEVDEEEELMMVNPDERIYKEVLIEAKNYQSYRYPP